MNKTESTIDMSQQRTDPNQQQTCRRNEQSRINNRHIATTNKTRSATDMPEQRTGPNQQQTCPNNEQNRINQKHEATTSGPSSCSGRIPAGRFDVMGHDRIRIKLQLDMS
jgi:hypothetical protein